ncbi:hypothetical protein I302_102588 [Kwoniella bestiolae CBS 10118]|uniref:Uncharacterized protein n=1 Tax=Kwoniella bestiolae CBS 10118 TaxID=1296100 RepID=A0A1B9GFE2_9TREE|nr:hypothetical protein I302_01275 [Kwoniella bestiolae CBS 10118]OCF29762.1 hypothetical protein I302_01275 [Kwoniella bestiolae CBS 10118]
MSPHNLTPEIWSMIFSFCAEPIRRDEQVSQPTLVKLLQVNSSFLSIVAPLLYRNVTIEDLGGFLRGLDSTSLHDESNAVPLANLADLVLIRLGYTKVALLRYVRHLKVVPWTRSVKLADPPVSSSAETIDEQHSSYIEAKSTLQKLSHISLDDNILSITIGRSVQPNSKEMDRIHSRFFSEIHPIRRRLLELFRPGQWTEYSPLHGYCFEPLQSDFIGGERVIPELVVIHTTLEGTFPLVWGTTNRIMVNPRKGSDNRAIMEPSVMMSNTETIPEELDMLPAGRLLEDELVRSLVYTIIRSNPPWLRRMDEVQQESVDERTKIEVYGLENVLRLNDDSSGLRADGLEIAKEASSDNGSGSKETSHLRVLGRIESRIRDQSSISEDDRWIKSGRKAFSIGLRSKQDTSD